jgi:type 1 glutamine amidotransferase
MKTMIPKLLALAALSAFNPASAAEQAPEGALEKIQQSIPEKPFAKPEKPRKLLVFSRTNGFRHASIATGKVALTEMGRKTGAFETVISEELDVFEQDVLKTFDAVCFLSPTMNVLGPRKDELKMMTDAQKAEAAARETRIKENLMKFIKSGHGYIGIHAATDCCYEWPEYGEMVNGYFDGHPWTADTMVSVKVEPGEEKHPLVAMFEGRNVEFKEEIYQLKDPYDSKSVHMLLRLDTEKTDMTRGGIKRTDKDFGIAWARHWSQGRVFYCSLGHNHEIYWHPKVVRHYLAGIQWALGDYKVDVRGAKAP